MPDQLFEGVADGGAEAAPDAKGESSEVLVSHARPI